MYVRLALYFTWSGIEERCKSKENKSTEAEEGKCKT